MLLHTTGKAHSASLLLLPLLALLEDPSHTASKSDGQMLTTIAVNYLAIPDHCKQTFNLQHHQISVT